MPPPAPGRGGSGRVPPPSYICYRCRQPGHFIQDCPNNSVADGGDENTATHARRAPVGIPQGSPPDSDERDGRLEQDDDGSPPDPAGGVGRSEQHARPGQGVGVG